MSAQDASALALVEEALGIDDPAARASFLDHACSDDAALRARVEQLLALDGGDAPFLQTETFARAFGLTDVIAERIGPYRVTGEIARGGMGQVLSAERDDGRFQQTVAIKLIRADIASEAGLARFAEERRILARLRHPGIVRILDGGEHEGRPWLAMDFIDGLPVTEALEKAQADEGARLDAFEQIAEAVAHAHRAFVIHADLKPSNILMRADGSVHLLDFGIARLIGDIATSAGESTAPSPLTRGYAAPERTGGAAPTVASDVFSLGMLLVQMLTGRLPDGALQAAAGSLLPAAWLKGDMQAIAACALAVDPASRYPDVAALLSDVRRRRASLPVRARKDAPWGYAAGRFARRHRRGLALAGAAFALLAATSVVTTLSYWRAEAARREADARFADARGAANHMIRILLPRLEAIPGTLPLRVETAAAAQVYLDRLAASAESSDTVRIEAASGLLLLARHLAGAGRPNLGQPDRADANLRRADALLAPMAAAPARPLRAQVLLERVRLAAFMQADVKAAEALAQEADALIAALPADSTSAPILARTRAAVLADLRGWQGRFAEEASLADAALALIPPGTDWHDSLDRNRLMASKAEALYFQDKPGEALPIYRAALAELRALRRAYPAHPYLPGAQSVAAWSLGTTLTELKRPREALVVLGEAETAAREALQLDPADREARRRLRVTRNAAAQALGLAGETGKALALMADVRSGDEALLAAEPGPLHSRDVVFDYTLEGETLDAAGRKAEACAADNDTLRRYDDLAARGLLTALDSAGNIKLLKARMARNCLGYTNLQ